MVHVSQTKIDGRQHLVFEVPLPGRAAVFMRHPVTSDEPDDTAVVIVDAFRFVQLWRNEPNSIHAEFSHGSPASWRSSRKFRLADDGFALGQNNPVPLAQVIFDAMNLQPSGPDIHSASSHSVPHLMFSNGITRTIWLLSHGCSAFPVECDLPGAVRLHELSGVPGTELLTVSKQRYFKTA